MRNESEIKADLKAAVDLNHKTAETMSGKESRELTAKIRGFQNELNALYTEGVQPCPKCKAAPIGMDRGAIYEVGCTVCPPVLIEVDVPQDDESVVKQKRRLSYSARGRTPAIAVENWNAENFVIDTFIDRVPAKK